MHTKPVFDAKKAEGNTFEQLQQLEFLTLALYLDIPGSPFAVNVIVQPYSSRLDYKEDLKLLGLTFTNLSLIEAAVPVASSYLANTGFRI